ncbi:isoprenylcysteine carboxylmethyltransferase family protein [candidate division KSB1 bacterium]|nr:isoprenylcysteine carboxylmethyltransferase family protein [candidate division KSB1 bacterium]
MKKNFFFKYRSYTPIPVIIAALVFAETTWISFLCGFVIALSGEMLRIWSVRYAGSATRTTGRVGADELVTTGPYGRLRNPLYLGNFLLSVGLLVIAWPLMPWFLIGFILLFYIQYSVIISLEEDFLAEKFQDAYQKYKINVPSFFPRFSNWGKGDRKPTPVKKALRTERNTLQSFTSVLILMVLRWIFG